MTARRGAIAGGVGGSRQPADGIGASVSAPDSTLGGRAVTQLRAIAIAVAAGCAAWSLYDFQVTGREREGWWLLLAAIVVSAIANLGVRLPAPAPGPPPLPSSTSRWWLGVALASAGALIWAGATWRIYRSWTEGFDFAWIGWTTGIALLAVGVDLAWGRWPDRPGTCSSTG